MSTAIAILTGIALAAACGFRVFVPLLATSLAVHLGYVTPSAGMTWIGSDASLVILAVATVLEVLAYFIPWVDHALDTIASPVSVVAGTLVAATAFGNIDPSVKWALALIAGGGAAAAMQGGTVITRAASTATTGGVANPIFAAMEALGAVVLSVMAILAPVVAVLVLVGMVLAAVWVVRMIRGRRGSRGAGAVGV